MYKGVQSSHSLLKFEDGKKIFLQIFSVVITQIIEYNNYKNPNRLHKM